MVTCLENTCHASSFALAFAMAIKLVSNFQRNVRGFEAPAFERPRLRGREKEREEAGDGRKGLNLITGGLASAVG